MASASSTTISLPRPPLATASASLQLALGILTAVMALGMVMSGLFLAGVGTGFEPESAPWWVHLMSFGMLFLVEFLAIVFGIILMIMGLVIGGFAAYVITCGAHFFQGRPWSRAGSIVTAVIAILLGVAGVLGVMGGDADWLSAILATMQLGIGIFLIVAGNNGEVVQWFENQRARLQHAHPHAVNGVA